MNVGNAFIGKRGFNRGKMKTRKGSGKSNQ